MARKHKTQSRRRDLSTEQVAVRTEEDRHNILVKTGSRFANDKGLVRPRFWSGDDEFECVYGEAVYKFWYEWLLRAHRDKSVRVNYEFYKDWKLDDLTIRQTLDGFTASRWITQVFRRSKKWRDLFGLPRRGAVERLDASRLTTKDLRAIGATGNLLVRINFDGKSKEDIDREIAALLREELRSLGRGKGKAVARKDAKYLVAKKYLVTKNKGIDVLTFRRTLAVADLEEKLARKGKKLEVWEYFEHLNRGVKRRKSSRKQQGEGKFDELRLDKGRKDIHYDGVYRMVLRDRRRYRKILENVARGEFTGKYTQ